MKKVIAVFGSLLLFAGIKTNAQKPQQPVKKETVKPTNGTAPKTDASDAFLKLGAQHNNSANPAFAKGSHPTVKASSSAANRQAAPRQTMSPAYKQAAPHQTMSPAYKQAAPVHARPKR